MAYFIIWRFSNEVNLSVYCRSSLDRHGNRGDYAAWDFSF